MTSLPKKRPKTNPLAKRVRVAKSDSIGGVYIIWHGGQDPWTVYVGQGDIAARIAAHRQELDILRFSSLGLFVTWAKVNAPSRDGVERFPADTLSPKVAYRFPQAAPTAVNLPW